MILGFRHAGLKRLFQDGDGRRISPELIPRVERVLARLDVAGGPDDMNLPGFRLHVLRGDRAGYWSVSVSANWRIVFRFEGNDVRDVDLVDYH
ncbi:MAG: type II toxin-antitoxin system RelE/ParE family toxin [Defluviicoccus sp.]|nr:type II toxin-antitoxin system RelE/ParE family toxin [Defluviicoccus sp.]MDE0386883.1 type II toxin-antitoxin system RelE/ParE family toxin [Defluviicoccus sp.]